MKLIFPILLNCLAVGLLYALERYTPAKKLPYIPRQIIIGIVFGAVSVFASNCGEELLGTMVNVRDVAPLTAGLVFGAPAGIISGAVGGLYRWLSVYWGGGVYTRLACTLASVLAGIMAAGVRKLMFDNKKPTWGYGIAITVVCEVLHMLLIFLTNMDDSAYAFEFVKGATMPMIIGNAVGVGLSLFIIYLLSPEKTRPKKGQRPMAQTFQRWLLCCIVAAFAVTGVFTFFLQSGMADNQTRELFTTAISDVQKDVRDKSDAQLLNISENIREAYEQDGSVSLSELCSRYGVAEINVVDETGLIIRSSNAEFEGNFNMNDTQQSAAFSVLNGGEDFFVQEYGPMGIDKTVYRKYAGISLKEGGYIQVGYSADQFHYALDEFVVDVTKNRHVGREGFVAVCDEELSLVTHNEWNEKHLSSIGLVPNEEMKERRAASELYSCNISISESDPGEEYFYVFTFVEGYCIIAAMPAAEAMFMRDASLYNSVFMQVLIFATLFVFIYFLIKKVIINNLKKVNTTLGQIAEGNLNVTVDVRSNAEFSSLSDDINSTVDTLKRYIAEAAQRIDKELEYAKQIQLSALPTDFPDKEDFAVFAKMTAAKEVGGDFYDFYMINERTAAFLVADVSGKGIPAAMFMMRAKTIIKDLAESGLGVNDIFTRANEKLCESNESGMFVTAWMGILDIPTGRLQYANAGHNPPLLRTGEKEFEYLRSRPCFVLAGLEGVRYRVNEMTLQKGSRLFLYTDGVTEAQNSNGILYGEKRLLSLMNENADTRADSLISLLQEDIARFEGDAPQFDDVTVLMVDYKKEDSNAKSATFKASTECLDSVIAFVEESLDSYGCSLKVRTACCVAIEELFVNVASYAYKDGEGTVGLKLGFDESERTVTFIMKDSGVPFDPLKRADPDITLSAEERSIGGLGIFIAKKTMDTVSYKFENGNNVLTMTKRI